jgi:exonuclease SbcC
VNLNKILIENFKSFGNSTTEIDLSFTGKKLLVGKNGTGKTSIFDALVWGIYGKTELKADNVVNKFTKNNCKVEVFFENSGKNYVITRYRKHNVHGNSVYLFENGENITPRTASDTQFLIEEIIGIDYRALTSSVVLSSETYRNFLRETNSVRLSIFDSVFSLKEIMDYGKITKNRIKEIRGNNLSIENSIASINGSMSSLIDGLKSYKESADSKVKSLESEILKLETVIEKNKESLDEISIINIAEERKKISDNENIIQKKTFLLDRLKEFSGLENISKRISEAEKEIEKLESELLVYEKIDVEKEKAVIEKYDRLKSTIDKAEKILAKEKEERDKLQADREKNWIWIDKVAGDLKVLEDKLEKLKKSENICQECGSIIGEKKFKEIFDKTEDDFFNTLKYLSEIRLSDEYFDTEIAQIDERIEKIESKIPKLDVPKYNIMYLSEIATNISKNKYRIDGLVKQKESDIIDYNDKLEKVRVIKEELASLPEIKSVVASIEELNAIGTRIESLNLDIKIAESKIEQNKKSIENSIDKKYVDSVASAIKKKKEEKDGLSESLNKNNVDLKYFLALEEVFSNGDEGFKKYFIENSIDLFNENINLYLPFFFEDDIEITFDKNLSETIKFKGLDAEWNELSSGQKTRAELAVVFSLFMMVRALFGSGTNLLVLDEIIDQNLDSEGVNSVVNILNNLAGDSAVFIVSHRDDYKERFDDILKVELDGNGFTKVS